MKKQIFIDDIHEYDYELIDDNRHTLYYSNASQWSSNVQGYVAMQIVDDGNGLISKFREENRIDYSEAERLFILLKLINFPAKYEIGTKILF